jgi:hypothetical protein
MKRAISILASAVMMLVIPPVAHAATMVIKPAKTSNLSAEENVGIALESFPTKAGIYLQQCLEPAMGARPTECNAQTQLWISSMRGASFTPSDTITMKLVAKFGAVDCTTQKCGIFARFDHTAGTDTSEDQFLPITFAPITTPVTTQPKTVQKQSVSKLPTSLKIGKNLALPLQTTQGTTLSYKSSTPKTCSVSGNILKALKAGNCRVQIFAPSTEKLEMFALTHQLQIKR